MQQPENVNYITVIPPLFYVLHTCAQWNTNILYIYIYIYINILTAIVMMGYVVGVNRLSNCNFCIWRFLSKKGHKVLMLCYCKTPIGVYSTNYIIISASALSTAIGTLGFTLGMVQLIPFGTITCMPDCRSKMVINIGLQGFFADGYY